MFVLWHGKLCVRDGRLWGRYMGELEEIPKDTIISVREYGFNNAFLEVRTSSKRYYKVTPWSSQYAPVVGFIEKNVDGRIRETIPHVMNRYFYYLPAFFLRGILKILFVKLPMFPIKLVGLCLPKKQTREKQEPEQIP